MKLLLLGANLGLSGCLIFHPKISHEEKDEVDIAAEREIRKRNALTFDSLAMHRTDSAGAAYFAYSWISKRCDCVRYDGLVVIEKTRGRIIDHVKYE